MMTTFSNKIPALLRTKWGIGVLVLILAGGGYWLFAARSGASYQFIAVTKGSLTETVSATGNTTPTKNVSLGFQNSGTIAHVYYNLGDQVHAGDVIATLNTASLGASLQQAQATVDAQQAQLDNLKAGSEPADIAASQAALDKAKQDLANLYASINDVSLDSYAKANDAVRTELNQLFTNGDTSSARLTYDTANFQAQNSAETQRVSVTAQLRAWQTELAVANKTDADL
ncbi:MAG: HlyD family secretion protein, partial [Minisyncoccota bacterium]